ncbi:MAG: hypothetical protein U5Q44_00650 [Dehalococcoidia bacterium]|nr:hypothetical protein [Dehalococcoidia bacterium]
MRTDGRPRQREGLVPRDVVRVVTSGTVTSGASLDDATPTLLGAAVRRGDTDAVALADVSTGEVRMASGQAAIEELLRSEPAELLLEDRALAPSAGTTPVRVRPQMPDMEADALVARSFGEHAGESLVANGTEAAALAHVLAYLQETFPDALKALQRVRPLSDSPVLALDSRTLRNLDVFSTEGRHSLFGALNDCRTAMGARTLRDWLQRPLRDREVLEARHDAVEWAIAHPMELERATEVLRQVPDAARPAVGRRSVSPRELHAMRSGLRALLDLGATFGEAEIPAP